MADAQMLRAAGATAREVIGRALAMRKRTLPIDPQALDVALRMVKGGGPLIDQIAMQVASLNAPAPVVAAQLASLALTLPAAEHAAFARGFAEPTACSGPELSLAQLGVRHVARQLALAVRVPSANAVDAAQVRGALDALVQLTPAEAARFDIIAAPFCDLFSNVVFRNVLDAAIADCCSQFQLRGLDRLWGAQYADTDWRVKTSRFAFAGLDMSVHIKRRVVFEIRWPYHVTAREPAGHLSLGGVASLFGEMPFGDIPTGNFLSIRRALTERLETDRAFAPYGGLWRPEVYFGSTATVFKLELGIGPDGQRAA